MKREILYKAGRRGDAVKVVVDAGEQRIITYYRDSKGIPRKKKDPDTKPGRKEAIAWAQAYHSERAKIEKEKSAPKSIDLEGLWAAFASSPAFMNLRLKSQIAYSQRFNKWLVFLTGAHCPDDTTLLDVDNYFTRGTRVGTALNQLRQVVNVARIVYRWGQSRKLVHTNELSLFRFQKPTDDISIEPDEYTPDEVEKLTNATDPQDGRQWRINVMLLIGSLQGMRANALTHLSWSDIDTEDSTIVWPAKYQKNGKEFRQPMTWDAVAALETAWYWREVSGYQGDWILFGGGGNKKLGVAIASPVTRARMAKRSSPDAVKPTTSSYSRSYRKERTADQDVPITYQGMYIALVKLEKKAKVEHKPFRAFHGLRKHAAGNVADVTGDARLAMEWINDKPNSKFMSAYLKGRSSRLDRAAAAAGGEKS